MFNLTPSMFISYAFVLLTAFAVHEFAHAYVAHRFGDRTPELNGRLTLNPMAHLDIMGSLMLVFAGFGWAKPVPINPYVLERRSRLAPMWVALAGPGSNLLMAILMSIPFKLGLVSAQEAFISMNAKTILPSLSQLLFVFVSTNVLLMVFNLIPISPLDGEKVLYYLLPRSGQSVMDQIRPYGPILLLVLVFGGMIMPGLNLLEKIISPFYNFIVLLLIG